MVAEHKALTHPAWCLKCVPLKSYISQTNTCKHWSKTKHISFLWKKKCLKNHRINNTREGQFPEGPKSFCQNLSWVDCIQAEIFDDSAWKTFFLKNVSQTDISWIESEVIPLDLNTYWSQRTFQWSGWEMGPRHSKFGFWIGCRFFCIYTRTNHFICPVLWSRGWRKYIAFCFLQVRSNTGGRTYLPFLSLSKSKDRAKYMLRQWKLVTLNYLQSKAKKHCGKITVFLKADGKWWNYSTEFDSKLAKGSSFRHLSHVSPAQAVPSHPVRRGKLSHKWASLQMRRIVQTNNLVHGVKA